MGLESRFRVEYGARFVTLPNFDKSDSEHKKQELTRNVVNS